MASEFVVLPPPSDKAGPELESTEARYDFLVSLTKGPLFQTLQVRTDMITAACERLNVDGLICRYHVGCRASVGDALMIKNTVQEKLNIPVLLLETESFDPRFYNTDLYKERLDMFKDIMLT